MIPDQWYAVLDSLEVPTGGLVGVTRMGERLIFWRTASGQLACAADFCVHRGAALSQGTVVGEHLQCPFHGFEYDHTGRCRLLPASGKNSPVPSRFQLQTYPIREAHGFIWLYWGEAQQAPPDLPFFEDLPAGASVSRLQSHWPVHYSRAVENQLDAVHLPFVHRTTIGRGGRTVVDGPRLDWVSENHLRIYVQNRRDDGTPARRADQLAVEANQAHVDFMFPNLWQNWIAPQFRIIAAFAPVDEANTVIYLHTYQALVRWPLARQLFDLAARVLNAVILGQDRRVVVTQRPLRTELHMREQLVQGDRPIVAYRTKRHALIDGATGGHRARPAGQAEADQPPSLG